MIANKHSLLAHPRALLAFQAGLLISLVGILIPLLSGGKGQLFLIAILGGVGALWLTQQPHWGVLIILAIWFTNVEFAAGVPYAISAILLIPLGLASLHDRGIWVLRVPQIKILLFIGLLFLVSTWWSEFKYPVELFPEKDQTARLAQLFVTRLVWLIFFLYFIKTRPRIELTAWLALGLIVTAAFSGFSSGMASGEARRAEAEFSLASNANRLAYICLFATTLLWYYRFDGYTQRWTTWTLPFLLFLPVTALTTGSRSGLLQMAVLGVLLVKEQKGWSVTKRICCVFFVGFIALLVLAVVPATHLVRATTFDPQMEAPGQQSLQSRQRIVIDALKMVATDPIFGAGLGNFPWVARAYFDSGGHTHNSYLWALTSGGIGVLVLYLLLFYVTYRMLRQLENSGPRELHWLSKGLRVNLILFLIFTCFADFWTSDFMYLIIALTTSMTYLWRREEQQKFSSNPI